MAAAEDKKKDAKDAKDAAPAKAGEGGDAAAGEQPKKKSPKLIIIIAAAVLVLGGAGGGAFFFLTQKAPEEAAAEGGEHGAEGGEGGDHAAAEGGGEEGGGGHGGEGGAPVVGFYQVPEILVNLSSTGSTPHFLKLKLTLEVASELDVPKLEKVMPRIIDDFQVYLRQLRPEDLQGSAGVYRLKEALLLRANQAAQPLEVQNVLFTEMLVQ